MVYSLGFGQDVLVGVVRERHGVQRPGRPALVSAVVVVIAAPAAVVAKEVDLLVAVQVPEVDLLEGDAAVDTPFGQFELLHKVVPLIPEVDL